MTCKSQASSTSTATADQKLKQRAVVDLPRMEMPTPAVRPRTDHSDQGLTRQLSVHLFGSLKRNLMTLSSNWTDYARSVLRALSVGR